MGGWSAGRSSRWTLVEEGRPPEAAIARSSVRIEDPDLGPSPRRARAVPCDLHLGPLTDHVATKPDPRASAQLEAESDGRAEPALGATTGRLEDDEQGAGATCEGGQPGERIGQAGSALQPRGEVEEQQVDRAALEERAGHREPLVDRGGRDDHEPFEADASGDGLDGVERSVEVHVRHDGPGRLGLRREAERESGPAARGVAAEGEAGAARDAAGPEDRVELGEAGRHDRRERRARMRRPEPGRGGGDRLEAGEGDRLGIGELVGERDRRQRADDLADTPTAEGLAAGPRRGRPPALAKRGEGVVDGSGGRHRTTKIERMFYSVKPESIAPRLGPDRPVRAAAATVRAAATPCYTPVPVRRPAPVGSSVGM
ncbi:MAG TPA: hypothetical protein VEY67_04725 [Candidatus Dormibacteraeota bacterium]|nr:hypothetical protein [Candidatus Dormibacteraeota bacterium]